MLLKASTAELRRLNTGSRASKVSTPGAPTAPFAGGQEDITSDGEGGGGVEVIGEWPQSIGLAGGEAGKLKAPWPAGTPWPEDAV